MLPGERATLNSNRIPDGTATAQNLRKLAKLILPPALKPA
jgi:hypothetical protein